MTWVVVIAAEILITAIVIGSFTKRADIRPWVASWFCTPWFRNVFCSVGTISGVWAFYRLINYIFDAGGFAAGMAFCVASLVVMFSIGFAVDRRARR